MTAGFAKGKIKIEFGAIDGLLHGDLLSYEDGSNLFAEDLPLIIRALNRSEDYEYHRDKDFPAGTMDTAMVKKTDMGMVIMTG